MRLHRLLHFQTNLSGRRTALRVTEMIEAGQGQISCILGQGLVRRTRLGNFRNAMPRGPAKDDQIDERIRTKAIRAMNRNTSRFTDSKQAGHDRSEEHTSELQSLMRISYAVFCMKKKKNTKKR